MDGRLVVFTSGVYVAGLAAALLLGNLREPFAGATWASPSCWAARRSSFTTSPNHSPSELVFIPILFAIGWLVGFALRERAAAGRAQRRPVRAQAEREREVAARIAVAEERARIARELHDIVAHAVSVMVLQVGAVRHRLPDELDAGQDRARSCGTRPAARRSRRCAAFSAPCAATATSLT